MQESRTKKVSINAFFGLMSQVINLLTLFIGRTFFIMFLGAEYLGVNGLFTNILTLLSFAELGIGNAIIFSMYKPLAMHDDERTASLMRLYKKSYFVIGIIVAIAGLCVTPFLDVIIKEKPNVNENLYVIYILFLANTVVSYFFVYKKSILIADQKNYVVLIITESVKVVQIISQIIVLYLTKNFILYLIIQIACTLLDNVVASLFADRAYPFLKDYANQLPRNDTKKIMNDVKHLAIYKFGSVVLNGTDNIIISAMVGVIAVGKVSNYVLIISSCATILTKITEAFVASVGNLNVNSSREKQYDVFKKMFFIIAWLYGFASVGLITVSNSFINAWVGSEYLLEIVVVIALVSEFYVKGVHTPLYIFRTTLGYFNDGKWSPLFAAIINVVLSIILCKWIGLVGVFIATPISRLVSTCLVDSVLIYKKGFDKNPFAYHTKYCFYLIVFTLIGCLCFFTLQFVPFEGWLGVIIKAIIVTFIFNLAMFFIFSKTKIFREIIQSFRSTLKSKSNVTHFS